MTRTIAQIGGPLAALLLLVTVFFAYEPLRKPFGGAPPPVETLTIERTVLDKAGISLKVRADGTEPVSIAQVQVDGAYWKFVQDPPGAVPRLASVWIKIPYPWVEGETHKVLLVTRTGLTFEHEIAVAWPTPQVGAGEIGRLTLGGLRPASRSWHAVLSGAARGRCTRLPFCPCPHDRTAGLPADRYA
jgi:hypothetical protein